MSCSSRPRWLIAATAAGSLIAGDAFASQGPGMLPGTASPALQMMMAIVVYGLCTATIAAGLIGALRTTR